MEGKFRYFDTPVESNKNNFTKNLAIPDYYMVVNECQNNECKYGGHYCSCTPYEWSCTDGLDNDNDGFTDCKDPDCAGKNTTNDLICCQSDDDCPAKNNTLGKCDTTGDITGTAYTCYWPKCKKNSDCVDNACCDRDSTIADTDKGSGACYSKGKNYKNKYLCDPPGWNAESMSKTKSKMQTRTTQNVFDIILNFFSQLFIQR